MHRGRAASAITRSAETDTPNALGWVFPAPGAVGATSTC